MEAENHVYSTFETVLQVRPDDIDMNQHVHNSRYLDYVLAARYDQMERCYGMSMQAFLDRGFSWYVKVAHIEHKRGLVLGDKVRIRTRVGEVRRHGVKVVFEMLREGDGKEVAAGYCDYVMVNKDNGRPTAIPEDVVAKYSV